MILDNENISQNCGHRNTYDNGTHPDCGIKRDQKYVVCFNRSFWVEENEQYSAKPENKLIYLI